MAIGMGISLNNAKGVVEALLGRNTPFRRTPKYHIEKLGNTWRGKGYGIGLTWMPLFEIGLCLYFSALIGYCIREGIYFPIPFLLMFGFGFMYVGVLSIWQGRGRKLQSEKCKGQKTEVGSQGELKGEQMGGTPAGEEIAK